VSEHGIPIDRYALSPNGGLGCPKVQSYSELLYLIAVPTPHAMSVILSLGGYYPTAYYKMHAKAKQQVCT